MLSAALFSRVDANTVYARYYEHIGTSWTKMNDYLLIEGEITLNLFCLDKSSS
jgi:hypothetical protein